MLNKTAAMIIIASIKGVVVDYDKLQPGRLKGLLDRLPKLVTRCRPYLSKMQEDRIIKKITKFEKEAGWSKKPMSISTLINFALILVNEYQIDERIEICLQNIYDFINDEEDAAPACQWSADLAFKKWEGIEV